MALVGLACLAIAGAALPQANAACVSITTQPKSQTVIEGCPVMFSVGATSAPPFSVQWYRNFGDRQEIIPSATNSTLLLVPGFSESGQLFVVLTAGCGSVTSSAVSLTVLGESVPPKLRRATGVGNLVIANFDVGVCPTPYWALDPESATNIGNYRLSGDVAILSARIGCSGRDVLLEVAGQLSPEATYTLSVNGVMDRFGNRIGDDSRGSFVAPAPADVPLKGLHLSKTSSGVALEWRGDGILQVSRNTDGPWNDLAGASSPWVPSVSSPCIELEAASFFFRVRWLQP